VYWFWNQIILEKTKEKKRNLFADKQTKRWISRSNVVDIELNSIFIWIILFYYKTNYFKYNQTHSIWAVFVISTYKITDYIEQGTKILTRSLPIIQRRFTVRFKQQLKYIAHILLTNSMFNNRNFMKKIEESF